VNKVRVWPVYKRIPNTNPLARNAFDEVGDPIAWEVRGPCGVESKHRTEKAADKAAAESQAFYDKFFPCGSYACAGIRFFEHES
jgi:hypothetical protein